MDNIKELEERSNSFFDEQEEERILAEVNQRYNGGMQSTEAFMREMGVMNSDVMTRNTGASAEPKISSGAYKINKDLASIETNNLSPSPDIGLHLSRFNQYSNMLPLNSAAKNSDRAMGGPMGGPASHNKSFRSDQVQGEELSYYALEIVSVADLIQQQNLFEYQSKHISSLRVMHCDRFSNLNGIQVQMFQNIVDLNLSSNNIEDINELSTLSKIRILNLSCNKIVNITGLENMMATLEKLVLSHNRIANLTYFKKLVLSGSNSPNLSHIDLNDNYIGDLSQVESLKNIASLSEIIFQNKNSNNPMCDFENYQEAVLHYLPQISKLDGISIYELGIDFKSQLDKGDIVKSQSRMNLSNNVSQPFHGHAGLQFYDQRQTLDQISQSAEKTRHLKFLGAKEKMQENFRIAEIQPLQISNNDVLIERIENLKKQVASLTQERDSTIQQYEQNETMWKSKLSKSQSDLKSFLEMNQSLKDDNKDLLLQLDKYMKRTKQLENEVDREKQEVKRCELQVHDLKKEKQSLQDQIIDEKSECSKVQKKLIELQVNQDQEYQKLMDAQNKTKAAEERCQHLYQQLMDSNAKGMDRWQEIQRKYEEGQNVINKQLLVIDELNQKVNALKEVNNQLEYSWGQKYQDDLSKKEKELKKAREEAVEKCSQMEIKYQNEIKLMKGQFRDDVVVIDGELNKQIQAKKMAVAQVDKLKKQSEELTQLLKVAAMSEEKKSAMLEEVKVAVQKEREAISKQQGELAKSQSQLEDYKKIKEDENLALKKEVDSLSFQNKELSMKHELTQERLKKLEIEHKDGLISNENSIKEYYELKQNFERMQSQAAQYEEQLKRECEDARLEVDDLSDLIKTKDRMLEDQNIVIATLKEKIKDKEEEIKAFAESKNKYRDFYEEKLQQEYDETEKQRARADDLQAQIQNYEYDYDQAKQDMLDAQDQLAQIKEQMKDKDQVIEFVEQEVTKIKQKQDEERQEFLEKDEIISSQANQLEEYSRQIEIKDSEIKLLLERMEQYKKHKDDQIEKLKDSLQKAQNDIKLLVAEHEKQKQKAAEKVRMLSEIFKDQ